MQKLQIFNNNQFGEVRTLEQSGKVLFCGSDVAKALGYDQPHKAIDRHCKNGMVQNVPHPQSPSKTIEMKFIPEGDLYRLITHSKLEQAEKFESWVFDDVLPTIRRHGLYATDELLNNPDLLISLAQELKDERNLRYRLQDKIEEDKPKVIFANAVTTSKTSILIGELAKLLKQNGIEMGQNRLFEWLRSNKYLISRKGTDYNMPTQKAMELALFEIKETSITHSDGHISVSKTPKVTGKGQEYFVNKFLSAS